MAETFGPGFQDARSRLYRLEYAVVSLALLGYLAYRTLYLGGLDWLSTLFWGVFPDFAFIPISLSSKRKSWPAWGAMVYNAFHTVMAWVAAFLVSWAIVGAPYWPIIGWLIHITVDRSLGYGLRLRSGPSVPFT